MGAEGANHGGRVQRVHVNAELNGQVALDQRRQPARGDGARVGGQGEHAGVLPVQLEVVRAHLDRARRHQIGQATPAQRQQPLVTRQAARKIGARLGRLGRRAQGRCAPVPVGLFGADDENGVVGDLTLEALGTSLLGRPASVRQLGVAQAGQTPRLQPRTAQVARRLVATRH